MKENNALPAISTELAASAWVNTNAVAERRHSILGPRQVTLS